MDNLGAAVSESLNYMYALQTICKSQWIPHLQIQGTHPIMSKNSKIGKQQNKDLSNHIIDSCFIDRIERRIYIKNRRKVVYIKRKNMGLR